MGQEPEWISFQRNHTDAKRNMRMCSTSLIRMKCKSKPKWDDTSHLIGWPYYIYIADYRASSMAQGVKNQPAVWAAQVCEVSVL